MEHARITYKDIGRIQVEAIQVSREVKAQNDTCRQQLQRFIQQQQELQISAQILNDMLDDLDVKCCKMIALGDQE